MQKRFQEFEERFTSREYIMQRLKEKPCDPKRGIPFVNRYHPSSSVHVFRDDSTGTFHFGFRRHLSGSVTLFFECSEEIKTVEEMTQIVRDYILLRKENASKGADSFNRLQFEVFLSGVPEDELFKKTVKYLQSITA